MREILFRGRRKSDGKWIEGDLSRCVVVGETNIRRIEDNLSTTTHRIDHETVCQYTGLTDNTKWEQLSESEKNKFLSEWNYKKKRRNTKEDWTGRKIFEGDIVRIPYKHIKDSICKVTFKDGMFIGICADGNEDSICQENTEEIVIGNIFDNPELLQ